MVIILIRRFVRPDREAEFLAKYHDQKPLDNPAFKGETLTKVVQDVPEGLRSFTLCKSKCITYLNVAKWETWEAFASQFEDQIAGGSFDPEIETAPRERGVLQAV